MRSTLLTYLTLLCLSLPLFAASTPTIPVAVADFETYDDGMHGMGAKLSTVLGVLLSNDPNLEVVERAELYKVLSVQEEGRSGLVNSDSAAKIGQLTGAKALITGKVIRIDQDYMIVAKLISCDTGRVFGESARGTSKEIYTTMAESLAKQLTSKLVANLTQFRREDPPKESVIKQIRSKLTDSKRPKITVSVPEQHFGAPAADPAAETELSLILQQLGFALLDSQHAEEADIKITGEAFSAAAIRRGNLHSCRSRLELKAVNRSGTVLAIDRETSVGVDISEQTAAKLALESAARNLAIRFIPQLVQPPQK